MEELPLFPDGARDVIPIVTNNAVQEALGNELKEANPPDIHVRKEQYGTLVGFDFSKLDSIVEKSDSRILELIPRGIGGYVGIAGAAIGVALSLGKSADAAREVRMFYTHQKVKTNDLKNELSIMFQGGSVESDIVALSTMSIGTTFDYSILRGFLITRNSKKVNTEIIPNHGDHRSLLNPLAEVLALEVQHPESILMKYLAAISCPGKFKPKKGKSYVAESWILVAVVPFLGKTVVSVTSTAFNYKPETKGQIFPMRELGKDKPIDFEVSLPSISNIRNALQIIRRFRNLDTNLRTDKDTTAYDFLVGVSAYLSLDIARQEFTPDRSPFSLWEVLEETPYVKKTLENLPMKEIRNRFPRILIKK